MKTELVSVKKSIDQIYRKVKPGRSDIEKLKESLRELLSKVDKSETEEFHKNEIKRFLETFFDRESYYINTKGVNDLVIHNSKSTNSPVGVLIETKSPTNKHEMVKKTDINKKAFWEVILYYMRERINNNNLEIRHLIITNVHEWFIFDAIEIERLFVTKKEFLKLYKEFDAGTLPGNTTEFFYNNIAKEYIGNSKETIQFNWFSLNDYKIAADKVGASKNDKQLVPLQKLYTPTHLLKLPFRNDSNQLDNSFYSELLHLIGLVENTVQSQVFIERLPEARRNDASIIENTISIILTEGLLSQVVDPKEYGETESEQVFNVALELALTWVNRVLFIKLLEGQLLKYQGGDNAYRILDSKIVENYDSLNFLFFQILAVKISDRQKKSVSKYAHVPFLNSSLFETTELEKQTSRISGLDDNRNLPIFKQTVLKGDKGKPLSGKMKALDYLLLFLDAYDFSSEGEEAVQEENKTLISASVLGLIFEKINGYKDGSFYTPGFITMYICREAIRPAVVRKFNKEKGWKCKNIVDVYNKIDDISEANRILNSLKICDPSVGSGHFLVSALNELLAIKSELEILVDEDGKKLKNYYAHVIDDELVLLDENSDLVSYNPKNTESQRVHKALFHEKQRLIENCLFGVDINPNSVSICRLRLWIELLKSAYYKAGSDVELETLPNIDINIKQGNSLIGRYSLTSKVAKALTRADWNIEEYRKTIQDYRRTKSKRDKHTISEYIEKIKSDFETEIYNNSPPMRKLEKSKEELDYIRSQIPLFDLSDDKKKESNDRIKTLEKNITSAEGEIEKIKGNRVYRNAFEWRLEFPEVLKDDGAYSGFDVLIGNPPYIGEKGNKELFHEMKTTEFGSLYYQRRMDYFYFFIIKSLQLLRNNGYLCFITTNYWITASGASKKLRPFIAQEALLEKFVNFGEYKIFDAAQGQHNCIFLLRKTKSNRVKKNVRVDVTVIENVPLVKSQGIKKVLLSDQTVEGAARFMSQKQDQIYDPDTFNIHLLNADNHALLEGISRQSDCTLSDIVSVTGGVSTSADRVRKANLKHISASEIKRRGIVERNGIFVLSASEVSSLKLTGKGKEYIKPYFKSSEIGRYIGNEVPDKYLIYAVHTNAVEIENTKGIYDHFLRYREILENRSQDIELENAMKKGHWFVMTNGRPKIDFDGPKIVCPYRSKTNLFAYNEVPWYAGRDVYYLVDLQVDLKYLLGYLNSSLVGFWLRNKGKVKGEILEMYPEPLRSIPFKYSSLETKVSSLVNSVIDMKRKDENCDISDIQNEIDKLFYSIFELTADEIEHIEAKGVR